MPSRSPTLVPVHPDSRRRRAKAAVLVWHDIVPGAKQVWFDTTVDELRAQFRALQTAGARPILLDDLHTFLATGKNPPPPGACVLCFDDNTSGIVEYAAPLLDEFGWHFAVSAHTKYVGITTGKGHNTWDQLRQLESTGRVRIVSQTHTHPPDLRTLPDAALRREMWEAKIRMEEELGRAARFVTYPSGKWDRRVALAAAEAGYKLGLTEDRGHAEDSPHLQALNRFSTHRRWREALAAVARSAKGG